MRSRLLLIAIGLVVGVGLTAGAVWANSLRTELVSMKASGGITPTDIVPNTTYTTVIDGVCVKGGAEVRIDRIRAADNYGAEILGFSLGPAANDQHARIRPVAADKFFDKQLAGDDLGPAVRTRCGDSMWDLRMLAVEIRAESLPAAIDGFPIDYTVNGIHKTTRSEFFVMLCSGKEKPEDDLVDEMDTESNMSPCSEWIGD